MTDVVARWVRYWHSNVGCNLIPTAFKVKVPIAGFKWSEWQDKDQSAEWLQTNLPLFQSGVAVFTGKLWRGKNKGKYFNGIDLDNKAAVESVCPLFGCKTLQELGQKTIVVLHKDAPHKGHVMFVSEMPIPPRSPDTNLPEGKPSIEIMSANNDMLHVPHSMHKNGFPYEVIGTFTPMFLNADQTNTLVQQIDSLCRQCGLQYLERVGQKKTASFEPVNEGNRDQQAFDNFFVLLNLGMKPRMALAALETWDKENNPPLGRDYLIKKLESAMKYVQGDPSAIIREFRKGRA